MDERRRGEEETEGVRKSLCSGISTDSPVQRTDSSCPAS